MNRPRPHMRRFVLVCFFGTLLFVAVLVFFQRSIPMEEPWPTPLFVHQRILYPCEPAGAVEVDGHLGEWADALWAPLGSPWQARGAWRGRRDAEARVALRWDEEALYVAARVRDDRLVSPADLRQDEGDALEISLGDGDTLRLAPRWPAGSLLAGIERKREDAAVGEGAALHLDYPLSDLPSPAIRFSDHGLPYLAALDVSGRRGTGGFGEGWGRPAQIGAHPLARPIAARRARLEVPVLFYGDLLVSFAGWPGEGAEGQKLTVWVNGRRVGAYPRGDWTGQEAFSVRVPAGMLKRGMNDLLLDFAVSPGETSEDEENGREGPAAAAWFSRISLAPAASPPGVPGVPPAFLFAGDATGDGRDELLGLAQGRPFAIGPRTGWGWSADERVPGARCAAVGDLAGDGDPDIAVLGEGDGALHLFTPSTGARRVLPLGGVVAFPGDERPGPGSASWRAMLVADANRDGENELVGVGGGEIEVLALREGSWVGLQRLPAPAGARWAVWGDFLGEGRPSLAIVAEEGEGEAKARFWRATYDGLVPVEGAWPLFPPDEVFVGEAEGNGADEILLVAGEAGADRRTVVAFSPLRRSLRVLGCANKTGAMALGRFGAGLPPPVGTRDIAGSVLRPVAPPDDSDEEPEHPFEVVPGTAAVAMRTEQGFDIEARIPWASLDMAAPRPGQRMEVAIEYVDDDGGRRPSRLLYSDPRATSRVEFLRGRLPWKLAPRHARFLGGLTAGGLGDEPLLSDDEPVVEILKGAAPGRLPPLDSLALLPREGGEAQGRRREPTESLGCEIERWEISPQGLPDGEAELVACYGRPFRRAATRTLAKSRGEAYRRALAAGREVEAELRDMVPDFPQAAPTLLTRAMVEVVQLERIGSSGRDRTLDRAADRIRDLQSLANLARRGGGRRLDQALEEPLRAYWCEIDGSPQPYELRVPPGYRGEREWPLVVHLRGAGYSPTRSASAPSWDEAFNLAPHGRGWTDYMHVGEDAVLRAIAIVRARYRIDPDRIYIVGSSMGGTGAWHLAARHPHLFAGIAPVCGNTDAELWAEKWGPFWPPDDPKADLRRQILAHLSPVTYAQNLAHVHVIAAHGARDLVVYPEASRRMVERLRQAGGAPIYREDPRAAHSVPARAREGMREWLLSQRRVARPRRVQLRAAMPGHERAYWARIERKSDPLAIAELDAEIVWTNEIEVRTEHVEALALDLGSLVHNPRSMGGSPMPTGPLPGCSDCKTNPTGGTPLLRDWDKKWGSPSPSEPRPALGRWGVEGPGVLARGDSFALRGDGEGEHPAASFRISPPAGQRLPWVTVAMWMRRGESDPGPVRVEIRPTRPDGGLAADGPRLARPLARTQVRPQEEWQRVFLYARLDESQDGALVCNISLGGEPTRGEVHVTEAEVWFGEDFLPALRRNPDDPEQWLTSAERRPGGWFPWIEGGQASCQPGEPPSRGGGTSGPSDNLIDPHRPLVVRVNGEMAYSGLLPEDGVVRIGGGGALPPQPQADEPHWAPPRKTDDLRGPIEHAFQGPFLLVYGTQGPERENMEARREAETFLEDWLLRYQVPCRIKPDTAVTEEDIERYHLVLYGGPQTNALTARVGGDLPVRVEGGSVVAGSERFSGPDLGMQAVYPNPLNPSRYVVVLASTTWRGMFQMAKRFGNWFGWRIYENRMWYDFAVFDDVSRGPDSFLKFGFFDEQWRLCPETTWRGDEAWRADIPRRGEPHLLLPDPDREATYLSEMSPASVQMRMGAPGFDRSFRGNPLRPGGAECERGLGVRVETEIKWRLDGKADRFAALVGVDNEGEIPTEERQRWTRVRFEVWGDGRRLAASSTHRWNDPPEKIAADVSGVDRLVLRTVPRGGRSWVYGSASWGEARVERTP